MWVWWGHPQPRAAVPWQLSWKEQFQQHLCPCPSLALCCVPALAPTLCETTGGCEGLTRLSVNCFRPQGWGTAATFASIQLLHVWGCIYSRYPPESAVPLLSHICVSQDPSWSFLHKEIIWIQLYCWHLLFHLLVFPKLGFKIWSFSFPRDCIWICIFLQYV